MIELTTTRAWMALGTDLFLETVGGMTDADLSAPSALPGWNVKHIISHVHYNAEALRRLARWASTGVECRMYESSEQRALEIESGTRLNSAELISKLHASAAALTSDLDALCEDAWRQEVVTALGRTVPAGIIPWLRTREVIVHTVDLGRGVGFNQIPDEILTALVSDAVSTYSARGHSVALAAWLTGRTSRSPELGKWM